MNYRSGNAGSFTFTTSGGATWRPDYFVLDKLTYSAATGTYNVTKPNGRQEGFSSEGNLMTVSDAFGNVATYTYYLGRLISVIVGTGTETLGYFYAYDGSGLRTSVTLRVGGVTSDFDVRQVTYQYSGTNNLELVQLSEKVGSAWEPIRSAYFRYYPESNKMQFAVEDDALRQMQSVNASWPQTADDSTVAEYADMEFSYYVDVGGYGPVSESKRNGGKYVYTYSYANSSFSGGFEVWMTKTTVVQPGGSTKTYYYDDSGSLMLQQVSDTSGNVWYPICQQLDELENVILSASSSAVASVDETTPQLFTLQTASGLIRTYEYNTNGILLKEAVQQGTSGPSVVLWEKVYGTHGVGSASISYLASSTVYRDANDTGSSNPATTTYEVTWMMNGLFPTFQPATMTITWPAVAIAENGSGVSATVQVEFNQWDFATQVTNEVGTITTFAHDLMTGALNQMVMDAASGGLNLTTTYQVDAVGRRIQELGPVHTISLSGVATPIRRAQWTQHLDAVEQVRTFNGYVVVAGGAAQVMNPVLIDVSYADDPEVSGGRMEEQIAAVWYGSGVPDPGYTFARANYVSWSTKHIDAQNELTVSRVYYLIPAGGLGVQGTNYAQTAYGYDLAGRQNQVTSPMGTIVFKTYNSMSWLTQTSVGTTLANLVPTELLQYDGGVAGGDGNLTQRTVPVDTSAGNSRITSYGYDWRDRPVEKQASDGTRTIITERSFDNLGNVIEVKEYQGSVAPANLINQSQTFLDALNRRYRTQRFGVDVVGGGTVGPALTSNWYFDPAGRIVRNTPAGRAAFNVTAYDSLGRPISQYFAYGGTIAPSNPGDISGATVIEQFQSAYDFAGNLIATLLLQRFDNATGTGPLQNPIVQPEARVYYTASYSDPLGRVVAVANVGTNGGATWIRSDTIPASSATTLVTGFVFDEAGRQVQSIDPMGTATLTVFDQAGRRTVLIENYQPGSSPAIDVNKTTLFAYNDDGNLVSLTGINATTGNQITQWIYGVTTSGGSTINSNGLVYQKIYPDGSGPTDLVTYSYNRQGQPILMVDQAGTTHAYSYDYFGRLTNDAITVPSGSTVDTTVQSIQRTYEARGMLQTVSSYGTGTAPLNQVEFVYDSFSQLAIDYQEHDGAVNTSTTLNVTYSYADGSGNTVRQTGTTYPDGSTVIGITYASTDADALSRPDGLREAGTQLCSYAYLGARVFVNVTYDAASGLELTAKTGGTGDAGDKYTALDRFGRLVETLWQTGDVAQVHTKYGRNPVGGIVWRQDLIAASLGVNTEDNYYWYDGLYQVQEHQRGQLNGTSPNYTGIVGPPSQDENFGYDATENWVLYNSLDPANSQTRTQNIVNEITGISSPGISDVIPTYESVGNMTSLPVAPGTSTSQYDLKWDAWNRLITVNDGAVVLAQYAYDGLTRRISKTNATETRQYYYNREWRPMEERVEGTGILVDRQYTWGLRDRSDLLRRLRSTGSSSLAESFFVLRDYLDPAAIASESGTIAERYRYNVFGGVSILTPAYAQETSSEIDWNFLFHGEFLDFDAELYSYGYRYYSPSLGRWVSIDPAWDILDGGLYTFTINNPVNMIDFLGLWNPVWGFFNEILSRCFSPETEWPGGPLCPHLEDQTRFIQVFWYNHYRPELTGGTVDNGQAGSTTYHEDYEVPADPTKPWYPQHHINDLFIDNPHGYLNVDTTYEVCKVCYCKKGDCARSVGPCVTWHRDETRNLEDNAPLTTSSPSEGWWDAVNQQFENIMCS